jgi:chaperonin GroES
MQFEELKFKCSTTVRTHRKLQLIFCPRTFSKRLSLAPITSSSPLPFSFFPTRRNGMFTVYKLSNPLELASCSLAFADKQLAGSSSLSSNPAHQLSNAQLTFLCSLSGQSTTIRSIKSLVPLLDRVLVQRVKAEAKTKSGIFLPESSVKELNEGKVLAVGPGALDMNGKRLPMGVSNGDRVLIPQVCFTFCTPRWMDGRMDRWVLTGCSTAVRPSRSVRRSSICSGIASKFYRSGRNG